MQVHINLKPGAEIIQQKIRPLPIHLQESVEKTRKIRMIERANGVNGNCFVSSAALTEKKQNCKNCIRNKEIK